MSTSVFTYGTLTFPDVMEAVTDASLASEPATLAGWVRLRVRGAVYPGVRAAPDGSVEGVLYRGVDARTLERLDRFEGSLYERRSLPVRLARGGACGAWVYVVPDALADRLAAEPWDPESFRREHHAAYLARCRTGRVAEEYGR